MDQAPFNFTKLVILTIAHLLLLAIAIVGYTHAYLIVSELITYSNSTITNSIAYLKWWFNYIMQLESYLLFGSLFTVGLIFYDVVSIIKWVCSFSFTRKTTCGRCNRRMVREPRQPLDRFISFIIPLMRFRCVACKDEYLVVKDLKSSRKVTSELKDTGLYYSPVKGK